MYSCVHSQLSTYILQCLVLGLINFFLNFQSDLSPLVVHLAPDIVEDESLIPYASVFLVLILSHNICSIPSYLIIALSRS
jgi:hypothetical protein